MFDNGFFGNLFDFDSDEEKDDDWKESLYDTFFEEKIPSQW